MSYRLGMTRWAFALLLLVAGAMAGRAQSWPAKPTHYFTDTTGTINPATGVQIDHELADYERETSNQFLVVVYPTVPNGEEASQFSIETLRAWGVGQKGKDNGAILFAFLQDHKLFIVTGRGLEGALPDILCGQIVRNEIVPRFKQGDFSGGLHAGAQAMMAAGKGEYQGTGQTRAEKEGSSSDGWHNAVVILIVIVFILIFIFSRFQPGIIYFGGPTYWDGGGSGGGYSGGNGGNNDTFSGGGGDSGGGGAGGSW